MVSLTESILMPNRAHSSGAIKPKHSGPKPLWFPLNRVWIYETWCHFQVGTRRSTMDRRWRSSKFRLSRWVYKNQADGRRYKYNLSWLWGWHLWNVLWSAPFKFSKPLTPAIKYVLFLHVASCFWLKWNGSRVMMSSPICHILVFDFLFGFLPPACYSPYVLPSPLVDETSILYI